MRILLASHSPRDPLGGASRVYHLLEEGLRARGHTVKVLHYEDIGISGPAAKLTNKLRLPQALSARTGREPLADYDVLMSSSGMLYPLFEKLRAQSVPRPLLVSHLHGLAYFDQKATRYEVERGNMTVSTVYRHVTGPLVVAWDERGCRAADLTIVQNGRDQDFLAAKGITPVQRIPLAVHPDILAAGHQAPAPETRDPHSFLWFGSWVDRKGRFYLPSAFEQSAAQVPSATLTIGGTNLPADVIRSSFAPEVRQRIQVLSRISVEEQIKVFGTHAIFLFPSLSEGFGYALLEAMAMGLAAVTTDTGLSADYIIANQHALVVPAASSLYLARAACQLAEDSALRVQIARKGQVLAQQFTIDKQIDAYETTFQQYVSKRSTRL